MPAKTLTEADCPAEPLDLFTRWYREAAEANAADPTALALATVDATGHPHVRMVLLKDHDANGFVFFTNYESAKAHDLAAVPHAELLFWWPQLQRQVRIAGPLGKVTTAVSDAYFASRPRGSQVGAWASPQSRPIQDRSWLEREVTRIEATHAGREVPRPPHWGGYIVHHQRIEFWQGRDDRLHDRIVYTHHETEWHQERLAP